jgi:hypothetical protein
MSLFPRTSVFFLLLFAPLSAASQESIPIKVARSEVLAPVWISALGPLMRTLIDAPQADSELQNLSRG